jgi:TusA-related sulfurtransferase
MGDEFDHFLDITSEVCPMTFVKTRLLIEKMATGETAEIRLTGGEPLENVPDSVTELGHTVLGIEREDSSDAKEIHRLHIRKA